jgi:hypothetical protein
MIELKSVEFLGDLLILGKELLVVFEQVHIVGVQDRQLCLEESNVLPCLGIVIGQFCQLFIKGIILFN